MEPAKTMAEQWFHVGLSAVSLTLVGVFGTMLMNSVMRHRAEQEDLETKLAAASRFVGAHDLPKVRECSTLHNV